MEHQKLLIRLRRIKNLDLGKPSGMVSNRKTDNISKEDFTTQSGGVSDNHEDMWRLGGASTAVAGREKVYHSVEEWRMIKAAVNHGTTIPAESRWEVLMGYQYARHHQNKQLLREKIELGRSHESASTASRTQWEECSQASHSGGEGHLEPESNRREAECSNRENHTQNLDLSFLSVDDGAVMNSARELVGV
jgi:hypothetical protein